MSNKKSQVLNKVATLLEKFSDRLVRVASQTRQNAEQISLVIGSLDKRDARLSEYRLAHNNELAKRFSELTNSALTTIERFKELETESDDRETKQTARDQNNVQSLVNLKDSTQKGFDQVRQDVESLLKTLQRLNERLGQVESQNTILTNHDHSFVNQLAILEKLIPKDGPSAIDQNIVNSKLSGVYNVTEELDRRIQSLEENPCAAWHHMVGIEDRVSKLEDSNARAELRKALPLILQLASNPTFVNQVSKAGYKFDAEAIFKLMQEATGWQSESPIVSA